VFFSLLCCVLFPPCVVSFLLSNVDTTNLCRELVLGVTLDVALDGHGVQKRVRYKPGPHSPEAGVRSGEVHPLNSWNGGG